MSNIDKQWLQQKIAGMEEHRDLFPGDLDDDHGNVLSALRIALASLEAEAVAWRNKDSGHCGTVHIQGKSPVDCGYEPLYLAPPTSVSVPDDLEMKPIQTDDGQIVGYECLGERYGVTAGCAWNTAIRTFRAAMLQGAVQPQNQQQNIPENIPVNTPCKEAPEHIWLQTAGVWPENGEFSELTWCSDNQHEDDTLYVRADVVTGNFAVIPDCSCRTCRPVTFSDSRFVVCPECGNKRCPHANDHRNACTGSNEPGQEGSAYPAAPQQEGKS